MPDSSSDTSPNPESDAPFLMTGSLNGRPTSDMFRDTGANISAIDSSLLPEYYIKTGEVDIRTMGGIITRPTTIVLVELNGHTFQVTMAVSADLGYDAILVREIPNLKSMMAHKRRVQPGRRCAQNKPLPESSEEDEEDQRSFPAPWKQPVSNQAASQDDSDPNSGDEPDQAEEEEPNTDPEPSPPSTAVDSNQGIRPRTRHCKEPAGQQVWIHPPTSTTWRVYCAGRDL